MTPSAPVRPCPRCEGSGEVVHEGHSLNPSSGLRTRDPQMEVRETCPRCDGYGAVVVSSTFQRRAA